MVESPISASATSIPADESSPLRLISFDFGLKKIGVATGNKLTATTEPLPPVPARHGEPQWHLIEQLINTWKPTHFIVGLPLTLDGLEGKSAARARQFGARLIKKTGVNVTFVDERFSSVSADALMRDVSPGKRLSRKQMQSRDSVAAALILQTYFESSQ